MIKKVFRNFDSKSSLNFFEKHTNCALPYCIKVESGTPGPTVLISGTIHGNEFVGAKFLRLFYKHILKKEIKIKRGTIYLLLTNPRAHKADKRFLDYDMNRSFVPDKDFSKYEHLRALEVEKFFEKIKVDYVIDLHSVSIGNNRMLIMRKDQKEDLDFWLKKTKLETVFVYREGDIQGILLDYFINKDGALSLAIECGNHYERNTTEIAKHEVYMLLSKLNMIDKKFEDRTQKVEIFETRGFIKTGPNFKWLVEPKTGTKIKKGQAFAKDEKNGKQIAKEDLILFMPTLEKRVSEKDHDAGFLCKMINT